MPRPDLASIDVNYRRIPIMAIGKDVYCDSRLIIDKLEQLYPNSDLTPSSAADVGVRKLLLNWTVDGGIFANCVKLIPPSGALLDKKFLDDRQKLMGGRRMTAEAMAHSRPDGLIHMRQAFDLLETTFLNDGRDWVLGTEGPTTADIDAVWPFEWLVEDPFMGGALPEEFISEKRFPKAFAYVRRFMAEVEKRKAEGPKPSSFNGEKMKEKVTSAQGQPEDTTWISDDPLQLKAGEQVGVYASDYGFTHRDRGELIGLTTEEVVIRNSLGLHLHFPRWNYRVEKVQPKFPPQVAVSKAPTTPAMRLIYHPQSPFSRKVFMVAKELGLAEAINLQKVVVCPVPFPGWSDNNDEVAKYNPMAKIPCLIPEDQPSGLFDSRIICAYLESLCAVSHKKDGQYWQRHTLHACADGMMDAAVLLAYEKRIREPRGLKFDDWVTGQKTKINRALDRLEAAAKENVLKEPPKEGPASAGEVAVAAAVGMMDSMSIEWRSSHENLGKWFSQWEKRESFTTSHPDKEWFAGSQAKDSAKI